jgi:hypothetical protein
MDNLAQTDNQAQGDQAATTTTGADTSTTVTFNADQQSTQQTDQQQQQPAATTQKWYESLQSTDLKSHPKIQEFKNADDMAKSYLELQSLLGHEKVPIPKDENDELAINMMNKVRGVPEAVDGYELQAPEVPEGMEGMEFGSDMFKEIAFKHKLTPAQAQGLQDDYVKLLSDINSEAAKHYTEAVNEAKAKLTGEWGLAYDRKVKLAQDVMNKYAGSKEAFEHINAKLGADPVALKFLAAVGEQFSEGSLGDTGTTTSGFTKTPAEAKAEYDKIMNDPNDIYWTGVRNSNIVSESVRRERISYVESLLQMQKPAGQAS